jgi:hypothetical protein
VAVAAVQLSIHRVSGDRVLIFIILLSVVTKRCLVRNGWPFSRSAAEVSQQSPQLGRKNL